MSSRVVALSALLVIAALTWGCASGGATETTPKASEDASPSVDHPARPRREPSKFDLPDVRRFPEYKTLAEASAHVAFAPRTPQRRGDPVKVVVRDRGLGKVLPREQRPMDVHYEDFWIAEAPYPTPKEAAEGLDRVMSGPDAELYMHEVRVHGMRALAHDPVDLWFYEDGKDKAPTGGIVIDAASVIWADGNMFYNITSDKLPYSELLLIAESMYE